MEKKEFLWRPLKAYLIENEPRVIVVNFGDGYEQRAKGGINNKLKKYSLTFRDSPENVLKIHEFLNECGAVESFTWKTGDDLILRTFVCRKWTVLKENPYWDLTGTFEEVIA
ncbi:phage tail protein [Yersinia frederiksenii]|nr:phage tail protein [Yersinia frederiksenii]